MMKNTKSVAICLAALAAGFGFGTAPGRFTSTGIVQADSLTKNEADDIYRELETGTSSLAETSRTLASIARLVMPSVVHVNSVRQIPARGNVEETGSGVIMTSPKRAGIYVVTNRHVINDSLDQLQDISISLQDGRVLTPTKVWHDKYSDIAVMEIDATNVNALKWGDSDEAQIGNLVLACGSPFGLSQSMTLGIISARGRSSTGIGNRSGVLNQDFLQTDAAINPGNSGGPLIDMKGRLVGINTAIASTHGGNEGIGFSIPSNLVRRVVEQLLEYGEVRRAYLGVKLDSNFDFAAAQSLGLNRQRGARVLEVYPNTPAAVAQFQYNDVVLTFDGHEILDESHLINLVSLSEVGRVVEVMLWRNGAQTRVMVDLAGRPQRRD